MRSQGPTRRSACGLFRGSAVLVDDDISDILAELPAGVNFTFFMDNCFSGDISRFAVGRGARPAGTEANSRFLPLPPEVEQAYVASRKARGQNRALARGVLRPLRGVLFSACKEDELAWEVNGQGEFTVRATRLLREGTGLTNRAFQQKVIQAFGRIAGDPRAGGGGGTAGSSSPCSPRQQWR